MRAIAAHAVAVVLFAIVTAVWIWPVLATPGALIPGSGAGDNFLFVWNLWWAQHSLLTGISPLWCPVLFAPFGVDLTLDTHTLLPAAIAGLFARDVLAGTNAIIWTHLFLNFVAAYALAWRVTRDWPAAVVAALFFGWSPYVAERLLGHFNLIAVWVFPLTAYLTLGTLEASRRCQVLLGVTLAAIAYLEYYYAVYAAVLVIVLLASRVYIAERRAAVAGWRRSVLRMLAVLIAMAALLGAAIAITGGTSVKAAGATISLRSAGNPLAAAWLLSLVAAAIVFTSRRCIRVDRQALGVLMRKLLPAIAVAVALTLPLIVAGARVWLHGDYVSQTYLWRSAPRGVDIATLLFGDPRGAAWGEWPLAAYRRFGIDDIEQTAWFPPAALALCAIALWRRRADRTDRAWIWTGIAFLVWALGPYAAAFGRTLPLPLPAILLRYIPIVSNARIPSRAIVLVYLAVAMLAALGLARLRERRHTAWAGLLAGLLLIDVLPARPPLFAVERPAVYDAIRRRPEDGAVCELPLGLRDSFGETGRFDSLVLWHQTIHDRAIAGGFISRLPRRIAAGYLASPVFGPLLRMSAGDAAAQQPGREEAIDALLAARVRFIVLDRAAATPGLIAFVGQLRLERIAHDERRDVLLVAK